MDSVDRRSMYLDDACSTGGGAGGRLCFAYGLALTLCHKAEPTAFEIDDIGIRMCKIEKALLSSFTVRSASAVHSTLTRPRAPYACGVHASLCKASRDHDMTPDMGKVGPKDKGNPTTTRRTRAPVTSVCKERGMAGPIQWADSHSPSDESIHALISVCARVRVILILSHGLNPGARRTNVAANKST